MRNDFSRIFSKIRKRKREGKELDKSKEQDLTIQLEEGRKGIVRFRFLFLYSFDKRSSSIRPSSPMHDRAYRVAPFALDIWVINVNRGPPIDDPR